MKTTNNEDNLKITRDNVLALDIATHTGFFSVHDRGTWDFTETKKRNDNKQHGAFRKTLIDFIQKHNIQQIVAEDVDCGRVSKQFKATIKLSEFRGILFEVCDTLNLPEPKLVNVKTVKKWATGDGNADKDKMMEFCKKRWGIDPQGDDNMSDACHIFFYYCRMYNL